MIADLHKLDWVRDSSSRISIPRPLLDVLLASSEFCVSLVKILRGVSASSLPANSVDEDFSNESKRESHQCSRAGIVSCAKAGERIMALALIQMETIRCIWHTMITFAFNKVQKLQMASNKIQMSEASTK